jgi:hypothetical protein
MPPGVPGREYEPPDTTSPGLRIWLGPSTGDIVPAGRSSFDRKALAMSELRRE